MPKWRAAWQRLRYERGLNPTLNDGAPESSQYASASFVGRNRVVFNIKGNDFRLIVAVAYQIGVVYVKFVGTHAEYDKVDAATVEME